MSTDETRLTAPQLRALFDILTHHETYAEVESFKGPEGIENYGYPFAEDQEKAPDAVGAKSSSPLLQLLLTRLVLPMPGINDLPPDFWNVKFKSVMKSFAGVNLSESYDKGALGTRKTLATAASAFHESITRGMLGGVPRIESPPREHRADPPTAKDLEQSWDHLVHEAVYGDLVDELFDYAVKSPAFEDHSPAVRDSIDYAIIHAATILHRIYVMSPEGQYLLKLIESTHKLIPYTLVCQTLRVGNAATMISAMVLDWDAGDFKKSVDNIKNKAEGVKSGQLPVIDAHLEASQEQHRDVRTRSIKEQVSIVAAILDSNGTNVTKDMPEQQHALCMQYYSAQLSVQDRERIIEVMCRQSPDYITALVRDAVAAFDPIIRILHDHVDLRKYVVHVQKFIDDLLEVNRPKKGQGEQPVPPSIEDYVHLLQHHRKWAFEYLHDFAKGCPEVRDRFRSWIKNDVMEAFKQDNKAGGVDDPTAFEGAGAMSQSLQSMFSQLDEDTRKPVLEALDNYDTYTNTLNKTSDGHLQGIVNGLNKGKESSEGGSMIGPGLYHARWQSLLDNTLITPKTVSGSLRHGNDVKDVKSRGKTGVIPTKDTWDVTSVNEEKSRSTPQQPKVDVVVEAFSAKFKETVADISSRNRT
ncbi:uncharacterized protein JN550_011831 [Neoarthrinium moseri]|uniref:uncharacterized protein n=1 Tax=Neoarthrinium moseri TaxID=1658444 RepID=UPI001FDBAC79|nr:uncharacterized protein JN550_011831 [Neoarthrinium moseri]KAI1859912.1 hypothetical protein JN550_011831 [Neoarthrinium moseri]